MKRRPENVPSVCSMGAWAFDIVEHVGDMVEPAALMAFEWCRGPHGDSSG